MEDLDGSQCPELQSLSLKGHPCHQGRPWVPTNGGTAAGTLQIRSTSPAAPSKGNGCLKMRCSLPWFPFPSRKICQKASVCGQRSWRRSRACLQDLRKKQEQEFHDQEGGLPAHFLVEGYNCWSALRRGVETSSKENPRVQAWWSSARVEGIPTTSHNAGRGAHPGTAPDSRGGALMLFFGVPVQAEMMQQVDEAHR